ncbi:unnamed protein product [Thlaspi arvense]|uniref:Uncharacterized protein n=1 Tax=Thlaspi arvense TaxID=13288 RepID=A0AAU9RYM0_THLAR|nr:unnamed protein product [Thlaspi arvense]
MSKFQAFEFHVICAFCLQDAKGNDVDLSIYKGKVMIMVNVASQWFFLTLPDPRMGTGLKKRVKSSFEENLPLVLTFNSYPMQRLDQFKLHRVEQVVWKFWLSLVISLVGKSQGPNEQIMEFACTCFKAEFPIFDKVVKSEVFLSLLQFDSS